MSVTNGPAILYPMFALAAWTAFVQLLIPLARTLALQKYDAKQHPRDLARQYDKGLRAAVPAVPAKRRAK